MSIVTRTGDKGDTGLFGGKRVPKSDARLHAYGTVDELNALLGVIVADSRLPDVLRPAVERMQHQLFRLGADLATPMDSKAATKRMESEHVSELEEWIQTLETNLPPQKTFLLPGGHHISALLHVARTVCRRAERWTVELANREPINEHARVFLNRLSDYLFLAARHANTAAGVPDRPVQY